MTMLSDPKGNVALSKLMRRSYGLGDPLAQRVGGTEPWAECL